MPRPKKSVTDVEYAEEVHATERMKRSRGRSKSGGKESSSKTKAIAGNHSNNKDNKKKAHASKKPIKHLRQKRRQQSLHRAAQERLRQQRKEEAGIQDHPGNIVAAEATAAAAEDKAADIGDFYWEVESVVGRRVHRGRVEYLIRWKGCGEGDNTWEPAGNVCDTAS